MSHSVLDKERVFLAYRALFKGENAQIRNNKPIKRLVNQHKNNSASFIKSLGGVDNVVAILKSLLKDGVFSSEVIAKKLFPKIFETSVHQDKQHSTAEASTAKKEAQTLVKVEKMDRDNREDGNQPVPLAVPPMENVPERDFSKGIIPEGNVLEAGNENASRNKKRKLISLLGKTTATVDGESVIQSLYPSYVPFRTQHLVLTLAQRLLEECCFDFTTKWSPSLIDEYHWDCSEAIELNVWTQTIPNHLAMLPKDAYNLPDGLTLRGVLFSVNVIRHSAVHRLRTSAKGIAQMIQSAALFAGALRDTDRQSQLEQLHTELESKIRAQELNKNFLEEKLARELEEIREIRKELDREEQEAIDSLYQEDSENKALVGSMLEDSVRGIFGIPGQSNEASAKQDESSDEAEVDDCPSDESSTSNHHPIAESSSQTEGSVKLGEPLSPMPEEPMQEEEPIGTEETTPLEEPMPVAAHVAGELWRLEKPVMEEPPMPISTVSEESIQVEKPVVAEEAAPMEAFNPETEPILAEENSTAGEEPIWVEEAGLDKSDPKELPTNTDWCFEESGQPVNGLCEHNGVGDTCPEPKPATKPDINATTDDVRNSLRKLIDPIIVTNDFPPSIRARPAKLRSVKKEQADHIQERILQRVSETLINNDSGICDLILERIDINLRRLPERVGDSRCR